MAANFRPSLVFEKICNVIGLVGAVLNEYQAAVTQDSGTICGQHPNRIEAVAAGYQRGLRFMLQRL